MFSLYALARIDVYLEQRVERARRLLDSPIEPIDLEGERAMRPTRRRLETLITAIQNEFLDAPGLALTLSDAGMRFNADSVTCQALLDVLVDTGVLTKRSAGTYVRYFPPMVPRRTGHMLRYQGRRSPTRGLAPQAA